MASVTASASAMTSSQKVAQTLRSDSTGGVVDAEQVAERLDVGIVVGCPTPRRRTKPPTGESRRSSSDGSICSTIIDRPSNRTSWPSAVTPSRRASAARTASTAPGALVQISNVFARWPANRAR